MTVEMHTESVKVALKKSDDRVVTSAAGSLLADVQKYDNQTLQVGLGKIGPTLCKFAKIVDHRHPELGSVLKGLFRNEPLAKQLSECLELARFAVDQKLEVAQSLLSRAALTKVPSDLRSFDVPQKNQQLIRLLKDRKLRDEVRATKTSRSVSLSHFYRKGSNAWKKQPRDFSYYLRFSKEHEKDIKEIERKGDTYSELGCVALSAKMSEIISEFSEHMTDMYCGFHRIKMTDVAIILAKEHEFEYSPSRVSHKSGVLHTSSKKFMAYHYAGKEGFREFSKPPRSLHYSPTAAPISEVWDLAPQSLRDVIDHLEAFPEASDRPIFDHYVVIVPGVDYPSKPNEITEDEVAFGFTDPNAGVKKFATQEECASELNKVLIKNGTVRPVLLGERDGNCYFVCYWPDKK